MKLSRLLGRGKADSPADALLASPLNDPALVQAVFGSRRPSAQQLEQKYFALPVERRPALSPWFDVAYYRETHPDVAAAGLDAYLHFLAYGLQEGRNPHPLVDLEFLRAQVAPGPDAEWNLARLAELLHRNPDLFDVASAESRRARPELTGSFDGFEDGLAVGWAYDPQDPSARHTVEIVDVLDGSVQIVGRGRGDHPRADLREKGFGDGRYHFAIRLSDVLANDRPHRLRARVGNVWLDGVHEFRRNGFGEGFDPLPDALTRELAAESSSDWTDRREAAAFIRKMLDINLRLGLREITSAAQELQAIDAAHPGIALVQLKLAEAKMRLGQAQVAAPLFEAASRSERLAGWALLGLGDAQQALGKREEAEATYRRGHELAPELPRLAARVNASGLRDTRTRARELAGAGETRAALGLLLPELVARPDNREICDLVIAILDAEAGTPPRVDPATARAERSRRLLELVLAQAEQRIGTAQ